MTHQEKVALFIKQAKAQGIAPYSAAPPGFRLLWMLGINVPPPFFCDFLSLALITAALTGFMWGLCIWLWMHGWPPPPPTLMEIGLSCAFGLLLGFSLAVYYKHQSKKLGLPRWDQFPDHASEQWIDNLE